MPRNGEQTRNPGYGMRDDLRSLAFDIARNTRRALENVAEMERTIDAIEWPQGMKKMYSPAYEDLEDAYRKLGLVRVRVARILAACMEKES